jgi:branched-chain amino acid transport system substrate-binding protein
MSSVEPARIGLLFDYIGGPEEGTAGIIQDAVDTLNLAVEEFRERGLIDRPIEIVMRNVEGLPRGSFRAARDAFYELVEGTAWSSSARGSRRTPCRSASTWRTWPRSPA